MPPYRAKKRFGQNFLKTKSVIDSIISEIDPKPDDKIIEIGAGRGALTYPLAESKASIIAVEFDNDLIGYMTKLLADFQNVELVHADFLTYQPAIENYILIGNLPYNITSPVIEFACQNRDKIRSCYFMMQKEVAIRLASSAGSKDWSPLAIFSQLYFDIEILFDISPKHFSPAPQVVSSYIRLTPREETDIPYPDEFDFVVRSSFQQRRKTLLNNLSKIVSDAKLLSDVWNKLSFDLKIRAEQVTIEQFLSLTNLLVERKILTYKKN
ncbi:MAG: ribosomal RNA small subunit methyltransferase A [Calditrichaeota bacterium]|nr:MAG: ribosomal RNA small subunit methyltransferase A [Calditrichota bacterium]